MTSNRRKHKFIDRWAQLSIAFEIILHALLLVAMIALLLFAPPFVTWLSDYSLEDHQAVARDLVALNASKWPLFVGLALFVGVISILFSHHIAGPGYKFRKVLSELNNRNLDVDITLRKWDYLRDVQEELQKHVTLLREDMANLQKHHERLSRLTKQADREAIQRDIQSELQVIEEILSAYKGLS